MGRIDVRRNTTCEPALAASKSEAGLPASGLARRRSLAASCIKRYGGHVHIIYGTHDVHIRRILTCTYTSIVAAYNVRRNTTYEHSCSDGAEAHDAAGPFRFPWQALPEVSLPGRSPGRVGVRCTPTAIAHAITTSAALSPSRYRGRGEGARMRRRTPAHSVLCTHTPLADGTSTYLTRTQRPRSRQHRYQQRPWRR